jgi:hypothetical protein
MVLSQMEKSKMITEAQNKTTSFTNYTLKFKLESREGTATYLENICVIT